MKRVFLLAIGGTPGFAFPIISASSLESSPPPCWAQRIRSVGTALARVRAAFKKSLIVWESRRGLWARDIAVICAFQIRRFINII